jgi:hypothetical protein
MCPNNMRREIITPHEMLRNKFLRIPLLKVLPTVKGRSGDEDDPNNKTDKFPTKTMIIYIGAGASAIIFITIIIIAVLVK